MIRIVNRKDYMVAYFGQRDEAAKAVINATIKVVGRIKWYMDDVIDFNCTVSAAAVETIKAIAEQHGVTVDHKAA